MGRSHIYTTLQPDENSCGPVSIAHALKIFGKRKSLSHITKLCKTTRNGTSTKNIIKALNTLGFDVLSVEKATLNHLISALHYVPNRPRAVIVSYLYTKNGESDSWKHSGHWAAVSSYSASKSRISLFDSYSGRKKSYQWSDFRERWKDYDLARKKVSAHKPTYKIVKKWQQQLLLVISDNLSSLPKFQARQTVIHPAQIGK